jgi:DNA-binding NarL/FixJ family response regulator
MRVVIAEDLALLREGIASMLRAAGYEVVGEVGDAESLLELVERARPDLAIVDIRMPPTFTDEGVRAAEEIRTRHPATAVLVLSQYLDSEFAIELISKGKGGIGYLLKERVASGAAFTDAVQRVVDGEAVIDPDVVARLMTRARERDPLEQLSDREREVLALMAEGRSNSALCQLLSLSPKTIEAHVRSIFTKLGLESSAADHRRVLAVLAYLRA